MKIDNNGTAPISPKRTEGVNATGKKYPVPGSPTSISGKDRAEVTGSARMLAKARAALENAGLESSDEVENDRIEMLRQQVQNGNYQIPVEDLARRLIARRVITPGDEE